MDTHKYRIPPAELQNFTNVDERRNVGRPSSDLTDAERIAGDATMAADPMIDSTPMTSRPAATPRSRILSDNTDNPPRNKFRKTYATPQRV